MRGKETGNILLKLRSHGVEEGRQISTSFSAYGSELFDVAGNMLDGISIWNKFDPVYQEKTGSNCCRIIGSPVMERSRCRIRWQIIMIR